MGLTARAKELRQELERVADRARHPSLELGRFTTDAHFDGTDDELTVPKREQRAARLRRAALILAANAIFEECLEDYCELDDLDGDDAFPLRGADDTFVYRFFPPRFRRAYDRRFFADVVATVAKVGYDLASPDGGLPACIAEEITLNGIFEYARQIMDAAQLGQPWMDLSEMLLEDVDFEMLFADDLDGIEHDPALQRGLGVWVPDVRDWFAPFNAVRVGDDIERVHDPVVVDGPEPVGGLDAISGIVALAREHARGIGEPDDWIADPADPEGSMAACEQAAKVSSSGWLTWEPHEGADMTRTDAVVMFRPHRHFPAGKDQPWAEVATTGVVMFVPLAAVVSYRPDPAVRRSWEQAFSGLGRA